MRHSLLLIGFPLLLLPVGAIAGQSLFDRVEQRVMEEKDARQDIANFAAQALNKSGVPSLDDSVSLSLTANDVTTVMRSPLIGILCPSHPEWTPTACMDVERELRKIAQREMEVLRMGRRLQAAVSGYEDPISAFSLQPGALTTAYADTLQIWGIRAEAGVTDASLLRYIPPPEDDSLNSLLDDIRNDLDALPPDQANAAAWRYQNGLDFVQNMSSDENPDGESGPQTERKLLFKRYENLENHLTDLRDQVESRIDPPLHPGEAAVSLLPLRDDLVAWVHVRDTSLDNNEHPLPKKDAGFRWNLPLDPIFPSLTQEDGTLILGGVYPPAPEKQEDSAIVIKGGGGLCETLSGRQGYLCRGRSGRNDAAQCAEEAPDPEEHTIILTDCSPPASSSSSSDSSNTSARDICRDMREHGTATGSLAPCSPGEQAAYPYTILGHTCFIRECAERAFSHSLLPGREPLVAQETFLSWPECRETQPEEPIKVPVTLTLPVFPVNNPGESMKELLIEYCQQRARPPLSPTGICQLTGTDSLGLSNANPGIAALTFVRELNTRAEVDQRDAMEGMGMDAGTALYREYLRRISASLEGTIGSAVEMLKRMAQDVFPTVMCPLNPKDDLDVCDANVH